MSDCEVPRPTPEEGPAVTGSDPDNGPPARQLRLVRGEPGSLVRLRLRGQRLNDDGLRGGGTPPPAA